MASFSCVPAFNGQISNPPKESVAHHLQRSSDEWEGGVGRAGKGVGGSV